MHEEQGSAFALSIHKGLLDLAFISVQKVRL